MEKQFVPYELAVKLKELGFDELCLGIYPDSNPNGFRLHQGVKNSEMNDISTARPLWQQAFDWFREKYSLEGNFGLCHFTDMTYGYNITSYITNSHYVHQDRNFKTYQSARLACLEKLIELIK